MAVTRQPNAIKHTAAADVSTENVLVCALVWTGAAAATDDLVVQNAATTELLAIKAGVELAKVIPWPFGHTFVKGLKTATMTAGSVEYILA